MSTKGAMSSGQFRFPDESVVLEACDRLVDFHAWDANKINPRGWLRNFDQGDDRGFALVLLSRFTFLADHLVDQLFRAAFQNISNRPIQEWETFSAAQQRWRDFCDGAIVTIVQGERPNPSDSGWLFARKARQALGISEHQLLEPGTAIKRISQGFSGSVIFVDDFVGSGEQFLKTWDRQYPLSGGNHTSFRNEALAGSKASFYYCNAMMTEYGRNRLRREAAIVRLSTGNIIPASISITDGASTHWPVGMRDEGIKFVERIGRQLGYTGTAGGEDDWRGFHKLGLGIAFEHSVPDANLPLFFSDKAAWTPLVRRT